MVLFELVGVGVFASASSLLFVVEIESSHLCGSWLLRVGDVLDQISEICESDRSVFWRGSSDWNRGILDFEHWLQSIELIVIGWLDFACTYWSSRGLWPLNNFLWLFFIFVENAVFWLLKKVIYSNLLILYMIVDLY